MMLVVVGIIIYLLFFIVLPGISAIELRKKWVNFRSNIFNYVNAKELTYNNILIGEKYCFKGRLESFKTDDVVWLKSESFSICLNLKNKNIFTVSNNNEELFKTNWSYISSIMEGTTFYVFGSLVYKNGVPYMEKGESELLVVLSEQDENVFESLLSKGRDKNEIWNNYAPYLYITGVLALIILSYIAYKTNFNKISSFFLLLIAGTPFYFIIPPGLYFYLKHRKSWDASLRLSVLSDLYKLKENNLKSNRYRVKSKSVERLSLLFYVAGYLLNIVLAGIILFKVFQLILFN